MKTWAPRTLLFLAGILMVDAASATIKSIPIVTQVQGVVFYRTSVTISNGSATLTTPVTMYFYYRSPADGSFHFAVVELTPLLGPRRVRFFDDIVQAFKDAGVIRSQDVNQPLFGSLLVDFESIPESKKFETAVIARTYSPATGGGTLGIAYAGRCFCLTGSTGRVISSARSGVFGNDGSTRSNLGIVNEGFGESDVRISYYDGATGVLLKQFLVSSKAGHILGEGEVYQINNIFGDSAVPDSTTTMVVELDALDPDVFVTGYGVQLDNTSNDGAFYFFEEEDEP